MGVAEREILMRDDLVIMVGDLYVSRLSLEGILGFYFVVKGKEWVLLRTTIQFLQQEGY